MNRTRLASLLTLGLGIALPGLARAQIGATTPQDPTPTPGTPTGSVAPRLRQFVQAPYPAEALAANAEGAVLLQLTLDAEGRVTEATVVQGLGHGLDEAALAAARQFVFEPGRRDGQAVPAMLRYRYRFRLSEGRAAATPRPRAVLRGSLRAEGDQPVAGATLMLTLPDRATRTATTDAAGAFRFELDAVGAVTVAVSAEGYTAYESEETLAERDDVSVIYRLQRPRVTATPSGPAAQGGPRPANGDDEGDEVQEAVVRGQRRRQREVTRQSLEFREILRMPGTGGDALRAVQNFPGVARAINGLLIVRGSTPQDTQIFADGTLIPLVYHFGGLSAVISTELLDRIDFYPGNYSARYGRAQGGIVDVGFRSPRRQGYRIVGNINLIDASLFVEGAITRNLSFAASFRRSYIDATLGFFLDAVSAVTFNSLPVYWDYQGILEWRPTSRDRVRLAAFGSNDSLSLVLNDPPENAPRFSGGFSSNTGFHAVQLLWDRTFTSRLSQRTMASLNWNNINFGGGEVFGLDLGFWQLTGRSELSYQASRQLRSNFGIDILGGPATIRFNGVRAPTEGQTFDPQNLQRVATNTTDNLYRPGAYAELEMTPNTRLRVIPAVRLDYARDAGRSWAVQPRMSFRWEFLRDWFVKGGVGVYNQPPQPNQSSAARNSWAPDTLVGNPNLMMQRSIHYGLGVEHNFSRIVSASVEGFYKDLDDQIVSQSAAGMPPYTNVGTGRIYGAEILLRHRPSSRFFGWLAYTISRSERRDAPFQPYRIFQFDQTHILTLIGSLRLGRGWEIGGRFRFVTGNPTTPVQGALFNGDTGTYTQIPGQPFTVRNAPFHQLDIRIDKTWQLQRRGSINLFLEVLNVYNRTNPEGVQYNYNFTQSATVGGIPFFPNLGLRVEY
ncbi:MAG: TonB family protein [Myxococcales bacterium]|nr:TonB family protein [Myxococcales bacterium]